MQYQQNCNLICYVLKVKSQSRMLYQTSGWPEITREWERVISHSNHPDSPSIRTLNSTQLEFANLYSERNAFQWECSHQMKWTELTCTQSCIAKIGGGYKQRGVAKGLKVPCLFMITEVSIHCQKKPGGGYTAYTPLPAPSWRIIGDMRPHQEVDWL